MSFTFFPITMHHVKIVGISDSQSTEVCRLIAQQAKFSIDFVLRLIVQQAKALKLPVMLYRYIPGL